MPTSPPPPPPTSLTAAPASPDIAVVDSLRDLLLRAEAGDVSAFAAIVARPGGRWEQLLVGDTSYHSLAGLNLRVDKLKELLLRQAAVVDAGPETATGGDGKE